MITIARPQHLPRFSDPPTGTATWSSTQQWVVPANLSYLMELDDDAVIYYRGKAFRVPPVPSKQGAQLYTAVAELGAFIQNPPEDHRQIGRTYLLFMQRIAELCSKLIRPTSRRGRFARRLGLWKPLHEATDAEVKDLADFLLQRRAKSTIRYSTNGHG